MIRLSDYAEQQLAELLDHYGNLNRPEASRALIASISQAMAKIEIEPSAGLAAPRPYPTLAHAGEAWIKTGHYWIAYTTAKPEIIIAIFYEASDIAGRYW